MTVVHSRTCFGVWSVVCNEMAARLPTATTSFSAHTARAAGGVVDGWSCSAVQLTAAAYLGAGEPDDEAVDLLLRVLDFTRLQVDS